MIYIEDDGKGNLVAVQKFTPEISAHNELLIKKFISMKMLDGLSVYSIDNYTTYIRLLSKRIGKRFEHITAHDIRNFLQQYKSEKGLSNYSVNQIRLDFNAFFSFLENEDYITKSPMRKIKSIKYQKTIKEPFSDEDIILMQDSCKNIKERAIIDFLYSTGCRVSEVVKLNIEDIDFVNQQCLVTGKGNKQRYTYFNSMAKIHLSEYLENRDDDNPALFVVDKFPHDRMQRSGFEYLIRELGNRAGVKNAYPHRFRRSIATKLLDKGMPIEQVQKFLGHSKLDTTLIYTKINNDAVKLNHTRFCN